MLNEVSLCGRLTKDPELLILENNTKMARIRIAVTKEYRNREDGKYGTNFFDVKVWQGLAKTTCEYCRKGMMVIVTGRLENNNYTDKEGKEVHDIDIIAEKVMFVSKIKTEKAKDDEAEDVGVDLESK